MSCCSKTFFIFPAIFWCCSSLWAQSQLCSGSLGDPKVNLDFGSGTGFGPALDAGVTTYQYVPAGVEHDGQYTLASNVNDAKADWHVLEDHTPGDVNGYMLVVNADLDEGEFYRGLVSGLCENTTFEFGAWITNANTPPTCAGQAKRPNVLFQIEDLDGTILASVATGDIQPSEIPRWENYGFTFNTGNKTEFYLVMVNNNDGGCGNDLAIDDITFRACGPRLEVNAEGLASTDMPYVCPGTMVDLQSSISPGFTNPLYQWQVSDDEGNNWTAIPGENRSELEGIVASTTRTYRVVAAANPAHLSSEYCRVVSNPVKVTVVPPLRIEEQPGDVSVCVTDRPFLEIIASGGYPEPEYQWETAPTPNGPWTRAANGTANAPPYQFHPTIDAPGDYYYRCIVSTAGLGCAALTSAVAKVTVLPPLVTLNLPVRSLCADDPPLPLSGGQPLQLTDNQTGVYSGRGVINGIFDPAAAGGPGTYEINYTLRNTNGCQYLATDIITVHPPALAEAGANKKILEGTSATLEGAGNGTAFSWSPQAGLDDPQRANPKASPTETTVYTLTVMTASGCTATDTVRVEVLEKLGIPSAFTPNQDGVNDTWDIQGISGYPEATIKVFNRWGTTVFYSRGYPAPWDGTTGGGLLPDGTYYYLITPGAFLEPVSGSVTLIR